MLAAFHAEQITYLEKKKTSQKRKGQGRDEQVIKCFIYVKVLSLMDRRGSRINSYRFHKRAPKGQVSRAGVSGACSPGKSFGFKVPKVPFLGSLNHSDRIFTDCLNHFLDFNF